MARIGSGPGAGGGRAGRWLFRRRWLWWAAAAAALLAGLGPLVLRPFWKLSSHFEEIIFQQPSRLYAQPAELALGRAYPLERLIKDLRGEGYREEEEAGGGGSACAPGRYRLAGDSIAVHLRSFFLPDGRKGGGLLEVAYRGPRIMRLWLNGQAEPRAVLEPPLLASYYGPDQLERRPVAVEEVAQDLIEAV